MNPEEKKEEPIYSTYITSNENYMSKIKNMLLSIISQLNSNNIIKSSLINLKDFDQKKLFDELDNLQKGYLNSVDIANFLKKFSLNFSEQLIRRFIQHYDKKTPYKLYFEDFNALITPKTKEEENSEKNIQQGNRDEIFLKILKNEFKLIVKYHEMIVDIKKCDNFITYESFISISEEEKNINMEKLKKFLGNNCTDEDIKNLLYYLDMDNDGLLTYDEFEDFFASMPVSQEDINFMNNEEIKYAVNNIEKNEKELIIKNNLRKNENEQIITNQIKEENINIKNNVLIQNKIIYEENINKITEVRKQEIKCDDIKNININEQNNEINNINNINNNNDIDNENINIENEDIDNININYQNEKIEEKEEKRKNNNKIVKKINYNNKNLLKNNKEIIEYETFLKNRYSSNEENYENNELNIQNNKNKKNNYELIDTNIINNEDKKIENNLIKKNINNESFDKNKKQNKFIIQKKEIITNENNINKNKKYEIQIKNNIISLIDYNFY